MESKTLGRLLKAREEVEGQVLELYHHKTKPKLLENKP
jgi:hypothetical protein